MLRLKHIATLAGITVLAACVHTPGPQSSGIAAPGFWSRLTGRGGEAILNAPLASTPDTAVDQQWWKHFEDPALDTLVAEALANNKSLKIAKVRVEEARAGRIIARSALFPQINGTGSFSRGNPGYALNDEQVRVAEADVTASWEADVFGKNQARVAQATAILQSAVAAQRAVRVGLLAELARNYFDVRNNQRQVALTRENLETQRQTLKIIEAQLQGALASQFDVQRASAQVSTTEALIPALQTAEDRALDRINVLLGVAPGTRDELLATTTTFKPLDAQVLVAAPAAVLAARPDVRVAERNFAAAIAGKREAVAELFPDISLTAFYGAQSATVFTPLASLTQHTNPWSYGGSVVQPILNFGRLSAGVKLANAQKHEAFLNYQQSVLSALEDMENALSTYVHETSRNVSLRNAVDENRKAAELANQQYSNGYTGLLDVLVAERDRLDAEANQAASDAFLRKDLVDIYAAAGGGWKD